jgi:uncharacterized protein
MKHDELFAKVTELFNANSQLAHDIKHATRSAALAKWLAEQEGYDQTEAEIAGLLHDIGRTTQKDGTDHGPNGVPLARELLEAYTDYDEPTKERILDAISRHSEYKPKGSQLLYIVQDADMLDGLGAIGLSRGYMSRHYLPDYDPDDIISTAKRRDGTVHDFFAFVMHWIELIHTDAGKRLARKRYDFMVKFLEEVKAEAEGTDYRATM